MNQNEAVKLTGMYIVLDNDNFPLFPTVSLESDTTKNRMVKLGPDKDWEFYKKKGYKLKKVTITIQEE